ncbi:MAG: MgtC/SapB family protein [Balneolaceae bacterium]|nr:MgtC/SapB family protein [Balneolaceae bacterium]
MEIQFQIIEIAKVVYAIFLGGLIGLEREIADKPAGLRTHMLVAGAATLLMILGEYIVAAYGSSGFVEAIQADPIRIMEAIITGISFLGAGTIIFKSGKESVEGLTTAASILFAAAIGITVALNQLALAMTLTVVVIIVLFGLGFLERKIEQLKQLISSRKNKNKPNE